MKALELFAINEARKQIAKASSVEKSQQMSDEEVIKFIETKKTRKKVLESTSGWNAVGMFNNLRWEARVVGIDKILKDPIVAWFSFQHKLAMDEILYICLASMKEFEIDEEKETVTYKF